MEEPKPSDAGEGLVGEVKQISKRAAEKAAKKAEKAKKKTEALASRPKEAETPAKTARAPAATHEQEDVHMNPEAIFNQGFLKSVYLEKPVSNVRTRFPPEPNGYLHIGHAKAITVNFGFAKYHKGTCNLRYDDTNPAKEEEKYFVAIEEMVRWLGFAPHELTYSSDHFDQLYELAESLVKKDRAFVCHCTKEEVNHYRGAGKGMPVPCPHRNRPVEESLTEFRGMRDGKYAPGEAHLRMKQDLTDGNPQMWDLAAYRVTKENHHHRTGDKWRIYPTYDFTHCLVDAFEGISHSLCTAEFFQSRKSYNWLLEELDYKKPASDETGPMQREYGRLVVEGTILSKRKIQMLAEGHTPDGGKPLPAVVRGWDDPRLYTLVALRRRGVPPGALLRFVQDVGVTTADSSIEISRFEQSIRKYLERTVPRLMVVLDPIKVVIENIAEGTVEDVEAPFDPKNPAMGSHKLALSNTIYIERDDFKETEDKNFFRLKPGGTVGLLYVPHPIKCLSISKDPGTGQVTEIRASYEKENTDKIKARIHWVGNSTAGRKVFPAEARVYNSLFTIHNANNLDWKNGDYHAKINPDSEVVYPHAIIESGFHEIRRRAPWPEEAGEAKIEGKSAAPYTVRFQGLRTAYFCLDTDTTAERIVLNRIVTLKEDTSKKL